MTGNTLIITGGMTPQVVTETVYALARRADPFVPDHIVCVVTGKAAPRFREVLPGALDRLSDAWGLAVAWRIDVRTPLGDDGTPVADIRDEKEAILFADLVADLVRQATGENGKRLHLSLAGGRKSMSFLAGAAMSLFARPDDELSHVLVHPEDLENCPDFWFPTPGDHWVDHRITHALHNAREGEARVELAVQPFLRVRGWLPPSLLGRPLGYGKIVGLTNVALGRVPLFLELVTKQRLVNIGGLVSFTLANSEFALYQLMAEWRRDSRPGAGPDGIGIEHRGWLAMEMFVNPEKFQPNPVDRFIQILGDTGGSNTKLSNFDIDRITAAKHGLIKAIKSNLASPDLSDRFGAPRWPVQDKLKRVRFGLKLTSDEIIICDN